MFSMVGPFILPSICYFYTIVLNKILTRLGLSDKETKIYEATLDLGPETIQRIARKAAITRTSAYTHVRSLIKKGLMGSTTRDKKTYFFVEPPENLSILLDMRKEETAQLSVELKKLLPQLRTLFETYEDRPRVRFFEGRVGHQNMINDLLGSKFSTLEEFTPLDETYVFSPPKDNDYRQKIRKKFKKIPMRIIYTSKKGPFLKSKENLIERRFLPKEKFPFSGSVNIYGNKISLISQKKTVTGVIIENKEIANTLRAMFNLAWDAAALYKK